MSLSPPVATRTRWRTPLAVVLAVPVGIATGEVIWRSGIGGMCMLVFLGPAATMAIAWLATRYRRSVVLLTALAVAAVLVNHAFAFDAETQNYKDPARHLVSGGVVVLFLSVWPLLAFRLWRPPARREAA